MAVTIEVPYNRTILSPKTLNNTYNFFSDFEKTIPSCFPGIDSFLKIQENVYDWKFKKFSYSNYEFQIHFQTKNVCDPQKIELHPQKNIGNCELKGTWKFSEEGSKTKVTVEVILTLNLPIPFFLKSVAAPLTNKEIIKLFDKYISNVEKALSA